MIKTRYLEYFLWGAGCSKLMSVRKRMRYFGILVIDLTSDMGYGQRFSAVDELSLDSSELEVAWCDRGNCPLSLSVSLVFMMSYSWA